MRVAACCASSATRASCTHCSPTSGRGTPTETAATRASPRWDRARVTTRPWLSSSWSRDRPSRKRLSARPSVLAAPGSVAPARARLDRRPQVRSRWRISSRSKTRWPKRVPKRCPQKATPKAHPRSQTPPSRSPSRPRVATPRSSPSHRRPRNPKRTRTRPELSGSTRLRLDLAYDGTAYAGWARQPGQRTVQGVVEDALATVLRLPESPALTVAGRTDAGVHARGQVAHVDLPEAPDDLARRLNGLLPDDV